MNADVMFSSKTDMWETPQDLFDKYNAIHHFETDVCATAENAKCVRFFTPETDGLKQEWTGVCWCNPPYGRQIGKWVKKAAESKAEVVMLLPARTDTKWFHEYCLPYGKIEFLKGRLKFGGAQNSAPFPSMIVVFEGKAKTNLEKLRSMTAEEVAELIEKNEDYMSKCCMQTTGSGDCPHLDENDNVPDGVCKQCFINWLNSEAKQ